MKNKKNYKIPEILKNRLFNVEWEEYVIFPIHMKKLSRFIVHKIWIENYMFSLKDIIFLNNVDSYWNWLEDQESCKKAVEEYLNKKVDEDLIDPYELIVDAFNK